MTIHHRSAYVTLNEVLQQVLFTDDTEYDTTASANTAIANVAANVKAQYKDFIYEVSEDLYNQWFRDFVPRVDTITVYAYEPQWCFSYRAGAYFFYLDKIPNADLLEIDSITLNGTAISSSYYRLNLSYGYPAQSIIFDTSNVTMPSTRDFSTSLVITGTWGYHENPSAMWQDSGDTVQNTTQISASGTSLTVTSGANFETFQYLKIEDEILFIESISSNTLTVTRGVNGSTAATHANGTAIYTYQQTPSVAKEVTRMVIKAYKTRSGEDSVIAGDTFTNARGKFELNIPRRTTLGSA